MSMNHPTQAAHRRGYGTVLLLNASYEPHDVVPFPHAVRMLVRGVAVVHEGDETRSIGEHPWPKVLRLVRYVYAVWMDKPAAYNREAVLRRDRYTCAYCGQQGKRLVNTVDHIVPACRGGQWSWLNTVAACEPCNGRKADREPREAGMRLKFEPWTPTRAQIARWGPDR